MSALPELSEKVELGNQDNNPKISNTSLVSDELDANFIDINEKSLLRKLDWKLLPPLTILYLLSFLDRSNGK